MASWEKCVNKLFYFRRAKLWMNRVLLGLLALFVCVMLIQIVLSSGVFQDFNQHEHFANTLPTLSASLAFEGFAPPAWVLSGWWDHHIKKSDQLGAMLSYSEQGSKVSFWISSAIQALVALLVLACAERWGAMCEWLRVALIRCGLTSPPPAQKSSWIVKATRMGLALFVCACVMLALALLSMLFLFNSQMLGHSLVGMDMAGGQGARWLARWGLWP
jgi:hypothetical protein